MSDDSGFSRKFCLTSLQIEIPQFLNDHHAMIVRHSGAQSIELARWKQQGKLLSNLEKLKLSLDNDFF